MYVIYYQHNYNFYIDLFLFSATVLSLPLLSIHPVKATAVLVSWAYIHSIPTILQYTSYFTTTGSVISQQEIVLGAGVTSTVVSLDEGVDGYQHNFTLKYSCGVIENPIATATFTFGKQLAIYYN